MSSGQISRDGMPVSFLGFRTFSCCEGSLIYIYLFVVSAMKKRLEREALEQDHDD